MDEDILGMLLTAIIIFIPVAGLTIRFALKPMVDSIAQLMHVRQESEASARLERRLALVEAEVRALRDEVERAQAAGLPSQRPGGRLEAPRG